MPKIDQDSHPSHTLGAQLARLVEHFGGDPNAITAQRHPEDGFLLELERLLEPRMEEFEKVAGLMGAHEEFRRALTRTIASSILLNCFVSRPASSPKPLRRFAKDAGKLAKPLRALRDSVSQLDALERGALHLPTWGDMPALLEAGARNATAIADEYEKKNLEAGKKPRGGGRPRFDIFDLLVQGLVDALELGTGGPATVSYSAARERREGKLVALVEVVLQVVLEWTAEQDDHMLAHPNNPKARGEYVRDTLRRRGKTRSRPI